MILNDEIDKLVIRLWGTLPISYEAIYRGGMNYVYAITLPEHKVMLKVYPPSRAYIAGSEYKMLLNAYQNGVKVPEVINFGTYKNLGFIIYHHIPGEDLRFDQLNANQQVFFSTTLVENLRKFSELSAPHFGNVTEEGVTYGNWSNFLKETIKVGIENLNDAQVISKKKLVSITNYLNHYKKDLKYAGMAWGDLKSENIIVNKGEFEAIIDLESCFYGDPLISLGYLYAKEGDSPFYFSIAKSFETFIPFKIEDIYYYALIRLIRISQYLKTPMPTGKTRDPITNYFKGINIIINDIL